VVAGRHRLAALHLLIEHGSFGTDETIPEKIVADDISHAMSLNGTEKHLKMHPVEQIVGFRAPAAEDITPKQIGNLIGIPPDMFNAA